MSAVEQITSMAQAGVDYAANLAMYIQAQTGSVCGYVEARMTAAEQRSLFGRYLGKGVICIDGAHEMISMRVKVGFGFDCEYRKTATFRDLVFGKRDGEDNDRLFESVYHNH
jgi:hypothetical protein